MSTFQDEIRKITLDREKLAKQAETFAPDAYFLAESGTYAEHVCELVRQQIRMAARDGDIKYDIREKTKYTAEKKTRPHYEALVNVDCLIDFSKHDFYWNRAARRLELSHLDMLFLTLDKIEAQLQEDGIVPVKCIREMFTPFLERTYFEPPVYSDTRHVREHLRDLDISEEIKQREKAYRTGAGEPDLAFCIHCRFAYFIQPGPPAKK